jgi:hypothetical protein
MFWTCNAACTKPKLAERSVSGSWEVTLHCLLTVI